MADDKENETVGIVTYNPGNRELLVQEGVLPYLEKVLENCVSENKCKELTACANIVITLQNLACVDRNKAEIMKHKKLLDSLVSISIDQCHSHHPVCIERAKDALSKLGMNPQDLQNDGTGRTGLLDMSSETKDSGRQIPMPAPQRMDSSGTHGIMHNSHGGLMTPSFEMTGGTPVLGMMGHEPNTTMLSDPRNAPKSISGNIRPEEETLNVGSSQVGSCTQIDPNSSSTVPMDSDMDNEQLSTIDSSSIRPIPSLPVVFSTESLSRSLMIKTAPFSGNTAVSTSRSATAKSSSTETVQQGSLSSGRSSTAGNSSSHAPPAISMSTTGGGLHSSSTLAKPSSPIVPGIGPDFSVLTFSPCEPLNLNNPQLPLFHESNLYTPCPPSVSSEAASTPRSPDQRHSITSPESRGSFSPSQPSPGHGVTTSEHAQEGFSAPPSPPHSGLPPADMNQEGSSLYRPDEDEAQTCGIISKADGKPAVLPSNPESESSGKAQNRAQRTVSSPKSSNKRAKLLPKLETASSDGAMCLPQTAASSSKSKNKRTKLSSNPVSGSSSRDTRIDRDMETEALETTSVTPLSTTILKAEGKRPRHYRNPKGGASSQSKVSPSHAGGMLNQFQKSVQNCQPPFKVSRDSPCRDEVPSNPCKSLQQNSDTEQQNCTKKRHTCPCCPKDFISRGDLKAHLMQEKHFKCKKCKECEKRFSYKKTLAKHVKDKHDPDKESCYKCMVCDKEFGCERYMKEHEKVHGQYAYERYKCRKCEKGFPYRSILKKHRKSCR
ncbi:zinc finger protein 341-like [Littorina saxatilis]|uniref:zinc finger protein 341-like n=1 Tax=Littorina saxatilis TaxID=31220 RepID=UPI0038B47868